LWGDFCGIARITSWQWDDRLYRPMQSAPIQDCQDIIDFIKEPHITVVVKFSFLFVLLLPVFGE